MLKSPTYLDMAQNDWAYFGIAILFFGHTDIYFPIS